jgi:hypothetical protein
VFARFEENDVIAVFEFSDLIDDIERVFGVEFDLPLRVRQQIAQVLHEMTVAMADASRTEHQSPLLIQITVAYTAPRE